VKLTDAGTLLAERARPILRQIELLRREIGRQAFSQVSVALPLSLQRRVSMPFALRIAKELSHVALRVYEGMDPGNTVPNTSRFHPRFDQVVAPFRQLVRDSSPINRKPIEKRSHAVEFPDRTSGHQVSQMPPTELLRTTGLWSEAVTDSLSGCIRARLCENSEKPKD
jgi:DNA-binding transcriptional LysR family regulator